MDGNRKQPQGEIKGVAIYPLQVVWL